MSVRDQKGNSPEGSEGTSSMLPRGLLQKAAVFASAFALRLSQEQSNRMILPFPRLFLTQNTLWHVYTANTGLSSPECLAFSPNQNQYQKPCFVKGHYT